MQSESGHANTEGADLLRGVAILMVVVYHAFGPIFGYFLPWDGWTRNFRASPSATFLRFYPVNFFWAGVALFFAISGFCIHYSYLRGGGGKFRATRFFWKRFWRLYPTYILALVAFCAFIRLDVTQAPGTMQFATHAFFLHNYEPTAFFGINASFWSIATEVQLYLLFPILLFLRSRIGMKGCLAVTFAVGCAWRIGAVALTGLPDHLVFWAWASPLMTWFDWSIGAFVAERFHAGRRAFPRPLAWLALLVPLFAASTLYKPLTTFSFTIAAVISAIILEAAIHTQWRETAWVRSLIFLGTISYSLYIWHQPLIFPITAALDPFLDSTVAAWVALGPLLVGLAWLSFHLLERPGIFVGQWLWGILAGSPSQTPAIAAPVAIPHAIRPKTWRVQPEHAEAVQPPHEPQAETRVEDRAIEAR